MKVYFQYRDGEILLSTRARSLPKIPAKTSEPFVVGCALEGELRKLCVLHPRAFVTQDGRVCGFGYQGFGPAIFSDTVHQHLMG